MPNQVRSLWPKTFEVARTPQPVGILREQGDILEVQTGGSIRGEVSRSLVPSVNSITYDFFIDVNSKPYRHKLLSVECGLLLDYPVTIHDHEGDRRIRVDDEQAYHDQLARIFNADATRQIVSRLLALARE